MKKNMSRKSSTTPVKLSMAQKLEKQDNLISQLQNEATNNSRTNTRKKR